MKKALKKDKPYWGDLTGITGDLTGIRGNLSGITGDLTRITGNLSGIRGDLSGITGNIDECELTPEDREKGIRIQDLII